MTTQSESCHLHPHQAERRSLWASEESGAGTHQSHEVMARFSHELRNYFCTIRNATRFLRIGLLGSDAADARVLIERQVEQMTRLVDDLLNVSRIRTGQLHLPCGYGAASFTARLPLLANPWIEAAARPS
jgi:signal transduction histidine kinase